MENKRTVIFKFLLNMVNLQCSVNLCTVILLTRNIKTTRKKEIDKVRKNRVCLMKCTLHVKMA